MKYKQQKPVAALVDLNTYDPARAISLRDAIAAGYLTSRGKKPSMEVVRRWANPKRGCTPAGPQGPRIVLPHVVSGNSKLTLPEWCQAFMREKSRIEVERTRRLAG